MKSRQNIFLVNSLIIIIAIVFSTTLFFLQIRSETPQFAKQEQEEAINTFWELLKAKGDDFRIVNNRLMAGDYVINGNNELPDKVKDIFGGTATIFMGDTRVSTNVLKDDGTRAIGTKLQGPAFDAIFKENRPYRGEAPILGSTYFTAYDPIKDKNGETIGVLYVGVKKNEFVAYYDRLSLNVIVGSALIGMLLIALAWGLLRERVHSENKLQEIADRLRLIADSVPVGIAYVDSKLNYIFVNRRYEEINGINPGKAIGRNARELRREIFNNHSEEVDQLLNGHEVAFTVEMPADETSARYFQATYLPHKGKDGEIIGYFAQYHDITRLYTTQETLRASEAEYRALFETTGAATFLVEDDTTVALVNNEFIRQFGYEREEVEGKLSWTVFVHPSDRERMLEYHRARRYAPGHAPTCYEFDAVKKNGTPLHIMAHVNLIPGTRRSVASYLDITELHRSRENLAVRESFLSNIIDSIQDGICIFDVNLRIVRANPVMEQRFAKNSPLLGRICHEAFHGSDKPCVPCPSLETLRDGNPSFKRLSRIENGEEVWLEIYTYPLRDPQNRCITGVIEYIRDITVQKQAEDALIAAEEKFRSLVEQSLVGIYIIQEGYFVYVNPKMAEIFGYTREELTSGITHLELTAPEERPMAAEFVRRRTAGEIKSIQYEFHGVRKDGAKRHIEVYGTGTTFNGKPAVIGTLLDITARKQAENALRESEDRFSRIFSQNDDAIILFKLDNFAIIDANPAVSALTGYSLTELKSSTPSSFIDYEDFNRLIDSVPMDDLSHAFQILRATCIRRDGSTLLVSMRAKILRLKEEYIVHCSIRDMSEKFRLEDEIRNTQAKLIQTNKMTSIGMLASSVAHEINNPNNCISVNSDMLTVIWRDAEPLLEMARGEHGDFILGGIPFSQMRDIAPRLLNGIAESSRRITAIVNNMKDFVREDKSGMHGAIDLNRVIQSAATIVWHHIHIYTDNFQMNLCESLPMAMGNGQQIEQVIINLIMNALQSLPDKQAGVHIDTVDTSGQGSVTIKVRDEGSGMDQATMARLKEPFFSTKLAKGGTGLGLYISDAIIKEHKGELEFSSTQGKGTCVTITLPLAASEQHFN